MSTIKISELGNLTAVLGNTIVPVVSNIAGTLTTVKGNVSQLAEYINKDASTYGNIIPNANVIMSLGNVTHRWKDLWISDSTIYLGNTTLSSSSTGSLEVAPAPVTLFDTLITTNNVVPANIWVTGGFANSTGTLSATLTYRDGSGDLQNLALTYGTDYEIVGTGSGNANLRVLLTGTYLYSTLGWIGFGNLSVTETDPTSTSVGAAGIITPELTVLGVSEFNNTIDLRQTNFDSNVANLAYGTVALSVSDNGTWGGPGALIFEGNNTEGNGIIPSNPSLYTLGTVDYPWLNVYADEITSATTDTINSTLANLEANAAVQAGTLATLTSNAASQAGTLATLTANAASQAGTLATLTSDVATLTANAGAQSGTLATITANLGAVSGTITTLTANAGAQAGSIATNSDAIDVITATLANAVSYNATFNNVTIASPTSIGTQGNIVYDINYVYICVASNAWIRTARVSW